MKISPDANTTIKICFAILREVAEKIKNCLGYDIEYGTGGNKPEIILGAPVEVNVNILDYCRFLHDINIRLVDANNDLITIDHDIKHPYAIVVSVYVTCPSDSAGTNELDMDADIDTFQLADPNCYLKVCKCIGALVQRSAEANTKYSDLLTEQYSALDDLHHDIEQTYKKAARHIITGEEA